MEVKEIGDLDHDRVIWEVVVVGHRLDVGVLEEDVDFLPDAPHFVEVPVEDLVVPHQDVEVHQEEQVRKHALLYLTLLGIRILKNYISILVVIRTISVFRRGTISITFTITCSKIEISRRVW